VATVQRLIGAAAGLGLAVAAIVATVVFLVQSTAHTAYKQIVAEELNVPYEAITSVVMGDTDRTPDGGFSAGFLEYGGQNLRKAAAYTYQAILALASTTLGVDKSQLTVKDGVFSPWNGQRPL